MSRETLGLIVDLTALAFSAAYVAYRLRHRRIVIEHRLLFTIGHAYYLTLSSLMARTRALDDRLGFVWAIHRRIPPDRTLLFSVWSLAILLAFHLGCWLAAQVPAAERPPRARDTVRGAAWVAFAAVALSYAIFAVVTVVNLSVIRSGYRSNDPTLIQSETGRGTLAAAATLVGGSLLYARSRLRDVAWPLGRVDARSRSRDVAFALCLVPVLATLLLAGGRLYATTMVVAGVIWLGIAVRPLKRTTIVVAGIAAFLMLTAYGSVRTGDQPSVADMQLFATTETAQGAIALYNTLETNTQQFDAVRLPEFLASDMINLAPRALLPNKDELRVVPEERGFILDNPLGGLNVGVSLLINFGSLGSLVAILGLGFALSRVRQTCQEPRATVVRVVYSIISATLLMGFYRDFFAITIVRWWIFIGLVLTGCVSLAMRWADRPQTGDAQDASDVLVVATIDDS